MLQITKGWAAPETVEAIERATVLAEKSGNLTQLSNWIGSRAFNAWFLGHLSIAQALADQRLDLCLRERRPLGLAYAYQMELMARFWLGDLIGAEKHFRTGSEFFTAPDFRRDPSGVAVAAYAYGSWTSWMLGYTDVAREQLDQMRAVTDARNPHVSAFAALHEVVLRFFMREYSIAEAMAARTVDFADEHHLPDTAVRCRVALFAVRAHLGDPATNSAALREAIAQIRSRVGIAVGSTQHEVALAEAQGLAGATTDALETIEQALVINPEELAYRPETLRIRGELQLRRDQLELAEIDFRDSIALAQSMGAKAWELRTTMSLARLLAFADRRLEAYNSLSTIYGWFTEGFDTSDLKDAKALLDQLSN
jgi:tetratricopeptide (TPR) repeat protein